ncbi:MAG: DsbC family protein [Rhodocyclaceae bacterium]|nr:DsbC family protein [Rhodocyclaceae bacterium]
MLKLALPALAIALLTTSGAVRADEDSVRKGVNEFLGVPAVDSVARIPYGGLYEVVLKSGELIYTDESLSFILDGQIIDGKTRRNITQARLAELQRIDFATLPLERAIKQVKGDGSRVLATFEDPNCGYCKRLATELQKVDNVTVYTFMIPILSADSGDKARSIWCASDKASAWNDWMISNKKPAQAACESDVIDKNAEFAHKLRINGTPTIFFADGNRVGGYLPASEIEKGLSMAAGGGQ